MRPVDRAELVRAVSCGLAAEMSIAGDGADDAVADAVVRLDVRGEAVTWKSLFREARGILWNRLFRNCRPVAKRRAGPFTRRATVGRLPGPSCGRSAGSASGGRTPTATT